MGNVGIKNDKLVSVSNVRVWLRGCFSFVDSLLERNNRWSQGTNVDALYMEMGRYRKKGLGALIVVKL